MRISKNWLLDYVDIGSLSGGDLSELLTTRVAEVDGVETSGGPIIGAVVAKVLSVDNHKERAALKVAKIQIGGAEVEVVCGAPNVKPGMLTVYVPPGKSICKDGREIKVESREVQGVRSNGILVSEAELGISSDHTGIVDLPEGKVGTSGTEIFGQPDTVIVLDNKAVTHRPDLWSHLGFARELSAILDLPIKLNNDRFADDTNSGRALLELLGKGKTDWKIDIRPETKARRFLGIEIDNVSTSASPLWMRRRLFAVGAGVRSLLVDLSNYVMHDVGQPNHIYDADKLSSTKLVVRMAQAGEIFQGLDGVERKLTAEDVVVADDKHAACLGGILGGEISAVSSATKRIFLEAASWDPVLIRMTAKRHAARTDASNRFEKNQSPYLPPLAIQRYSELLKQIDPKVTLKGNVAETFVLKPSTVRVKTTASYLASRVGASIDKPQCEKTLKALGFQLHEHKDDTIEVTVPHYRATRDVSIADDLVEEVGRAIGYNNIESVPPRIEASAPPSNPLRDIEHRVRDLLRGLGFSEISGYSFMSAVKAASLGYATVDCIEMENPLDADESTLRTTQVLSVMSALNNNARFTDALALFEVGRAYESKRNKFFDNLAKKEKFKNEACFERRLLTIGYSSGRDEKSAPVSSPPVSQGADFFALAGAIRKLFHSFGVSDYRLDTFENGNRELPDAQKPKSWMHPHRLGVIIAQGQQVGVIAEVAPDVLDQVRSRTVIAEIELDLVLEIADPATIFSEIPRFPDSLFEMSVVADEEVPFKEIEGLLRGSIDKSVLRRLEVLDVYKGKPLDAGKKSVSVKLYLGADDRTLSTDELTSYQDALMRAVESKYALRR